MSIVSGAAKQASTRGFYPKTIEGSLRFNDDDTAYLTWTPDSAGNRKTWTWSGWVKRCNLGGIYWIFGGSNGSTTQGRIGFNSTTDKFIVFDWQNGDKMNVSTNAVLRDPSAWYHIVASVDTTQVTPTNRVKIYINGVQQETTYTVTPTQNLDTSFNDAVAHSLGRDNYGSGGGYSDVYLAEVHFLNGIAATADDFGELKNGVWVAKTYEGLYDSAAETELNHANGFHLTFQDDTEVEAFNTVLYRGNGGTQSVTGMGFAPDLVWVKARSNSYNHALFDVVRGATKRLYTDSTIAEQTEANSLTSFDSDGFTTSSGNGTNGSGQTYVAWGWKAGTAVSGTTSQSRAYSGSVNTDYGFSIIKYAGSGDPAGTGPAQDVPHHLGQAPDFILVKSLGGAFSWSVYHSAIGATKGLYLNLTNAEATSSSFWNDTAPTSTNFTVGTNNGTNDNRYDHIAYCWADTSGNPEGQRYSKFDSYLGDGSTDGSLEITTGFKPSFILFKKSSGTSNWNMVDSTRDVDFDGDEVLFANEAYYEGQIITGKPIEFTPTGFKIKTDEGGFNTSGQTYIYAAFADTREAAFWLDQSGNDNDWQPVNLDHNDTVADSPTDNFATWSPINQKGITLSNGNLTAELTYNTDDIVAATMAVNSGQWYWEVYCDTVSTQVSETNIGITSVDTPITLGGANRWPNSYYYQSNGQKRIDATASAYGTAYSTGITIGVALDCDANTVEFFRNNVSQGSISIDADTTYYATVATGGAATSKVTANFGQQPFKYDPPA